MVSDSDPLSLVFVLIFFFSRRVIFTVVSKLSFCLRLQQVIAQLRELHVYLGCSGPSSLWKISWKYGTCATKDLCFPIVVSSVHPVAVVALGSIAGEAACVLDVSDSSDQTTGACLFLHLQKQLRGVLLVLVDELLCWAILAQQPCPVSADINSPSALPQPVFGLRGPLLVISCA